MSGARRRFVISHVGRDRPWAEWIAARLADAGEPDSIEIRLVSWRWNAGTSLVTTLENTLLQAEGGVDRIVLVFSTAMIEAHEYAGDRRPDLSLLGRVVPVRVEPVGLPEPWSGVFGPTLFDVSPVEAANRLVTTVLGAGAATVASDRLARTVARDRSGPAIVTPRPRLPGHRPDIWNVPARTDVFVGRDEALVALRTAIVADGRVAVEGRFGMGGVGKTRLALEYAHRFGSDYDLIWWIPADRPVLVGDQFAALAVRLGLVGPETDTGTAATVARTYLRRHSGWLIVFDNAESAEALAPWLPGGDGHTIITSRTSGWGPVATPLEVELLSRAESIQLLRHRDPGLTVVEAGRLAAVLGDLPLAVVLAVGFLAETGTRAGDYLTELAQHVADVLDEQRAVNYPHALAGAIATATSWLATRDPTALAVARVCAFLAPRPIPVGLLGLADPVLTDTGDGRARPSPRVQSSAAQARAGSGPYRHPLAALEGISDGSALLQRSVGRLQRLGLVEVERVTRFGVGVGDPLNGSNGVVSLHRLVSAILRDQLGDDRRDDVRAHVDALVAAADPGDPTDPHRWSSWMLLLPHLYAAEPAHTDNGALRATAVSAARTLLARGDVRSARDLADQLHRRWLDRLGPDHEDTLRAARCLAQTLRTLGRFDAAQELDADVLRRRRETLGEDHSDSLAAATDLADDAYALGDVGMARALDEEILARRQRVLGESHPSAIESARRLARDLTALGEAKRAEELRSWVERAEADRRRPAG
ncbi:FxSxx-COOH system tetratricopeptide repeat protein [Cryptosporangium aurantiacum]|uniref:Tetratricopeptide repeat-containing protein n=1 Tax=Cryptosporangium aurantiacum TaxID=134849 RepID=A0A1M7QFZ3_9ACTN|nr:FxSxx-COOH system tetratricopeptide repeat protein [Cryptosporangium aurantiacum]SHN29567.1 Tetratricopeptide repeat-containing protein [Cryptosporangium aurantiacum]